MNQWYKKAIHQVMGDLKVTSSGLSQEEVERRRKQYGYNELKEGKKKSALQVFLEQFKDFLVIILLVAAAISVFTGELESALVIFAVLILNAILGTVQHVKAEQSLNSLKALSSPTAKVLRDGNKIEVLSREVTVGDILYLEAGDFIAADGRIIENYSLQVNESSLTGESENAVKMAETIDKEEVPIGDRKNMVHAGSLVTYGRATVVVTDIGMNTEIGKVATLLESTQEKKTPLQENLDDFGKKLAIAILGICAVVFALSIYRKVEIIDAFMFAVALAVAAIPEALSSIVTIVLALGTQKMAKENAIIRKLQAVEGLGSVSVICSDKTGTLTQNKMTVQKIYVDENIVDKDKIDLKDTLQKKLVNMSILCNDASVVEGKELGDPTEVALVNLGRLYKIEEAHLRGSFERMGEIPFDSDRKLMSTVHHYEHTIDLFTKGAVDVLLKRATHILTSKGTRPITDKDMENIEKANQDFSKNGLRVLAFGYKEVGKKESYTLEDEKDFTFVGLISMMDPPREESAKAVEDCIQAGIKPVMITGDHKITASAIAKQIGILKEESEAIEGSYLDTITDEQLREKVDQFSVYARVSPEHKIRIVRAWQDKGNVVAMTGDGVNDAPALKQANIGVAMGITGTEVAKDAASMVLTDDNFATIVKSIANGRNIYRNIKNAIQFLLSGNTAGILSVLYASLAGLPVPFAAVHLLFINLLTDSLPAIALGLEPHKKSVMKEKPRSMDVPIMSRDFGTAILGEGLIIAIATVVAFYIGLKENAEVASTMAFATLCLARLFHGFTCRAKESIFKIGLFTNPYVWAAFGLGVLLLSSVLLIQPVQGIFEVAPLSLNQLGTIAASAFAPFVVIQVYKLIRDALK